MKIKAHLPHLPGFSHPQEQPHDKKLLRRHSTGTQLGEVAAHMKEEQEHEEKAAQEAEFVGVIMEEEAERQRRMAEATDESMQVNDVEEKAARLKAVRDAEEEERNRRIREMEEEDRRESLANLVGTVMDEELERARRMSGNECEQLEERNRHKEAALVKEKIEKDREEKEEEEKLRAESEADLIGTVIDEREERRERLETGDSERKINAHMTASMMKMHLAEREKAEKQAEEENKTNLVHAVLDEFDEAQRRLQYDVQQHDIAHAHQEAELIAKDPLRWPIPPATTDNGDQMFGMPKTE